MAIKLIANYSKKAGLPGFSSVQYSLTVETEVSNLEEVEKQSHKLYDLLQESVDREIQNPGFVPEESFGRASGGHRRVNGSNGTSDTWACSPKQKDLILKLVDDHKLDKGDVEELARDRFNKPVKALNRLEASGLIEELIENHGKAPARRVRR